MNRQQADNSGIAGSIACNKFGEAVIFDIVHMLYRSMVQFAGKGYWKT